MQVGTPSNNKINISFFVSGSNHSLKNKSYIHNIKIEILATEVKWRSQQKTRPID